MINFCLKMVVIKFPKKFIQLDKYPGYYWHTEEKQLYSLKITGVLRPMVKSKAFCGYGYNIPAGWRISKNASRRVLTVEIIEHMISKLDLSKDQKVPMEKNK